MNLNSLRIRGVWTPIRTRSKSTEVREDIGWTMGDSRVHTEIENVTQYMIHQNSTAGMGFCILGVRVSFLVFKSIIVAYASLLVLMFPRALRFFSDDAD